MLRELYPNHTVTPFSEYINLLGFPGAMIEPIAPGDLVTSLYFIPLGRHLGQSQGVVGDRISFGSFRVAWDKHDFILYVTKYPMGFGEQVQQFLLHEGSAEASRSLLRVAGIWGNDLHEEIYVFNQYWIKDHNLWQEIQKADWKDIILKDEIKAGIKKDVFGFFESQDLYKNLSIPWKRGLIMLGPPGNGKTITMKAIMKDCDAKGYTPLYVRSFQSWMGEQAAMTEVFGRARQMAPCVIILEDLDSLINDRNRSFFLNELDGFEGNDGLLVLGSTNHFDRLDPALSGRPSRFDRKYKFDDPDEEERTMYVKYWQNKLKHNKDIDFPNNLVTDIAASTAKFSFAYLKEAFVSTLVLLAGAEETDEKKFGLVIKKQIRALRNALDQDPERSAHPRLFGSSTARPLPNISSSSHAGVDSPSPAHKHAVPGSFTGGPSHERTSAFGRAVTRQDRIWSYGGPDELSMSMPGDMPPSTTNERGPTRGPGPRDVRNLTLSGAFGRSYFA